MFIFFAFFAASLLLPILWPEVDLWTSALFYRDGQEFFLADHPVFTTLHWLAYYGARGLGIACAILVVATWQRCVVIFSIDTKGWLFLLLALLIGPVLIANVGFKDHWGRPRPREVTEFGGAANFTPALEPHLENAHANGSFVSGDGAFGFFLPTFAYVAPRRLSRRIFWATMAAGGLFGFARLVMGAHFLSDILYAAFFMLLSSALVHAALYGWRETGLCWRSWFTHPTTP